MLDKLRIIILSILLILILSLILNLMFNLSFTMILSYIMMGGGLISVFSVFGKFHRFGLFIFSSIFLIGIIIFVEQIFEFANPDKLLLPAALLIPSINFLLFYIEDSGNKLFIWISFLLFLAGILVSIFIGSIRLETFLLSIGEIFKSYWIFIIIIIVILMVLYLMEKKNIKN